MRATKIKKTNYIKCWQRSGGTVIMIHYCYNHFGMLIVFYNFKHTFTIQLNHPTSTYMYPIEMKVRINITTCTQMSMSALL